MGPWFDNSSGSLVDAMMLNEKFQRPTLFEGKQQHKAELQSMS